MSIAHLNEVRQIERCAATIGALLPEHIVAALRHLQAISAPPATRPTPGSVARDLAQHLGDPAAMSKARKLAAEQLLVADTAARVDGLLVEACGSRLRALVRRDAEQISAAFGAALKGDLAVLTVEAPKLPAWFKPEQAADLAPDTFAAWTRAAHAYDRITATTAALNPVYSGSVSAHAVSFNQDMAVSLRFAQPPVLTTSRQAFAFRNALVGRTERTQTLASQGSTFVDGLFVPAALAQAGAAFVWATPSEVGVRAQHILDGMNLKGADALVRS